MPTGINIDQLMSAENPAHHWTTSPIVKKSRAIKKPEEAVNKPMGVKPGFTFGCDPEGFLFDGDQPVSAMGIIPGNKSDPYPVDCGAVQVDGMAAEFNINPAKTYKEWEGNIKTVIDNLRALAAKSSLELRFTPSVVFPVNVFDAAPDEAKELGCQPDIDAHTGNINPLPQFTENPYMRCAGGHVHAGWSNGEDVCSEQHIMNCQDLGQQLDWFLGGWSVNHDKDTLRRKLYGKMGAIRYKPYGVEYRTLSNFWVDVPELRLEVWNRLCAAVYNMRYIFMPERGGGLLNELREAINHNIVASHLMKYAEYPLLTLDSSRCRL